MHDTLAQSLDPPGEMEMATHSSILAWRIPRTGAWQATVHEVARAGHDLVTKSPPTAQLVGIRDRL